jgi:hypothetical protein
VKRKRRIAKAVGKSPNWLRTVQIAKPTRARLSGTFGPASEVRIIKLEVPPDA